MYLILSVDAEFLRERFCRALTRFTDDGELQFRAGF